MRNRIRIFFRKYGDLRFISHRDLVRTLERLFRRTRFQLRLSEGFHPKVKLSFPLALALGIEGAGELMEVEFTEEVDLDELMILLRQESPPGLEILSVTAVPQGHPKPQAESVEYQIPVPPKHLNELKASIQTLMSQDQLMIVRSGRKRPIDAKATLLELEIRNNHLRIKQRVTTTAQAQPREILKLLGADHLELEGFHLTRTDITWKTHDHHQSI